MLVEFSNYGASCFDNLTGKILIKSGLSTLTPTLILLSEDI